MLESPKKYRLSVRGLALSLKQRHPRLLFVTVFLGTALATIATFYGTTALFPDQTAKLASDSGHFARTLKDVSVHIKEKIATPKHKWPGHSIHSVMTSSGDHYQNFQGRIMYATYKLVQKMPGGERLTGFTRLLHRTVPDILMDEIPTFIAQPKYPNCDGWCEYPVANRPNAIKSFFDEAKRNESLIQGAWVFMLECDYVWMQPMQPPGSAYDPNVPGVQFLYDYINPRALAKEMIKLYQGPASDIPASGPAPVLMRLAHWHRVAETYVNLSSRMESDPVMKKNLGWVREMYAWSAAMAHHKDVRMLTEHHTDSSTIVQPPFDEKLGRAALCHYTWGALYHEGPPSKGGKQIYRWEKRDFNALHHVLKIPNIPMPPEYKDGWILEFDAPLTRPRHDLVVKMLAQMNRAIDTLPDLNAKWREFEPKLALLKQQWAKDHPDLPHPA